MNQAEITYAASQAWIGFWQTCMADAGGSSALDCNYVSIRRALAAEANPLQVVPPSIPALPATDNRPRSELARRLEGDGRISDITIRDVLIGLEDYFAIFRKLRRIHPAAYSYFRRVGAPLCFDKTSIFRAAIEDPKPIVNPNDLPAFIGVFFSSSREEARDTILNDKPTLLDFQLYEKRRRNVAVVSPWKWKLYDHHTISLARDIFTKAERKAHSWLRDEAWGFHYFIGIGTDGEVQALPMHMGRQQALKNGETIHHNQFVVPPGLSDLAGPKGVDAYAGMMFAVVRNFCAAALSGAQLSVRRGDEVARFGIPLSHVRGFFRDRDGGGRRRSALLHYVGAYEYERQGRTVTVGEHLRGARRFRWRDYDLTISAPGIHHPSPEALVAEPMSDDDVLPIHGDTISIGSLAKKMQRETETVRRIPFHRGQPTVSYRAPQLEEASRRPL
jgi:hypothetical protein